MLGLRRHVRSVPQILTSSRSRRCVIEQQLPLHTRGSLSSETVDVDLDLDEQRVIAMLGAGFSAELCDPVALLTLTRLGLVRSLRLTPAADKLRKAAVLQELAA
jgi:hypothetical protein